MENEEKNASCVGIGFCGKKNGRDWQRQPVREHLKTALLLLPRYIYFVLKEKNVIMLYSPKF
jgi:hypothetical protein